MVDEVRPYSNVGSIFDYDAAHYRGVYNSAHATISGTPIFGNYRDNRTLAGQ